MTTIGSICIAGYHFGLQNDTPIQLAFETGFEDFLTSVGPHIDRQLIFKEGFTDFANSKSCYQAKANKQLLWEIRDSANGRWFLVYHPETGELQQQAQYNPIKQTWTIHCEAQEFHDESVLNPLAYPMAPLLWYVLTTEEPLLMVHASGLTDGKKGRIFAGFSGVGKSTMAGIWERNGAQVINDDRLLLKREADGTWRMYNTPMYYQASAKSAVLQHIYFPYHSPTNTIEKQSGAKAIAQLLAFTIHHGYDAQHVLHHSNIAEQLLQSITAAKLGVVPTSAIVNFIKTNEQNPS